MNGSCRKRQLSKLITGASRGLVLAAAGIPLVACGSTEAASTAAGDDASTDGAAQNRHDAGRSSGKGGDSGHTKGDAGSGGDAPTGTADTGGDSTMTGDDGSQTDTGPTGDGGHDAGAQDACSGACVVASGQDRPTGIAVDDTSVYWLNAGPTGTVVKVAVSGGSPVTLTKGQNNSVGIAVDSTSIYFTTSNAIRKMPLDGEPDGGVETLASDTDVNAPTCIAVDTNNVYWANNGGENSGAVGSIVKVPVGGGSPVTLAKGLLNPYGVAVDSQNVYWTTASAVMKLALAPPPDGGTPGPVIVANNQSSAWTLAVDETNVYWVTTTGGTVVKAPIAGGTPTTLATGQPTPWGVATDSANVYWTTDVMPGGTVLELGLDAGAPTTLASMQVQPQFIAVRAGKVHWTDDTGNIVTFTSAQ